MDDNRNIVTGRDVLLAAVGEIGSLSVQDAERIALVIQSKGYVCVPRIPTEQMIKAAWADALAEDAPGVWNDMINEADGLNPSEEEMRQEAERRFPHVS